ncbi:hypothetical protein Pint_26388 [Pistacia integerrima]|uniref:Uncharacterized protein n=1 Tax=Pistacia integerrima TaxID=434235 RepID=A0ACC0YDS9_9ROSI|nr:hypothetical protein Pint_26388 [Pistacia integerrima]
MQTTRRFGCDQEPNLCVEFCMVPAFRLISVKSASVSDNSSMLYINKLEELPMTIGKLNKKAAGNNAVIVGFVTKPSHEDFAKRGSFPMNPTPNGLIFVLLSFETPLSSQLQVVDVVLHKATDEILSMNWEAIQNLLTESHTPQACRSCKGSEFGFFAESWYYLDRKVVILGVAGLRSGQDSLGNDKVGSDLNSVGACSWGFTVYGVGFLRCSYFAVIALAKITLPSFVFAWKILWAVLPSVCLLCAGRAICLLAEDGYGAGLDLFIWEGNCNFGCFL